MPAHVVSSSSEILEVLNGFNFAKGGGAAAGSCGAGCGSGGCGGMLPLTVLSSVFCANVFVTGGSAGCGGGCGGGGGKSGPETKTRLCAELLT